MTSSVEQAEADLNDLFSKNKTGRKLGAYYKYFGDVSYEDSPGDIASILGLTEEQFSKEASKSINILENIPEFKKHWHKLKWQLMAYLTIQDMFTSFLHDDQGAQNIFRQWYFYYESKYLLTEAILCGLNGFSASIGLLARLFIEFSLLQNYIYRKINNTNSYKDLERYFKKGFNPNWSTIIKGAMPSDNFCKPIKKRIQVHLDGLSKSFAHPYQPIFSSKHFGSYTPEQNFENLLFPFSLSMILEPILWVYYVNFPMLFHPVCIYKKFGFNYPTGIFMDHSGAKAIQFSVTDEDYAHFKEYTLKTQEYSDAMEFFNSRQELTNIEIEDTWDPDNDGKFEGDIVGHCKIRSKMRVIMELMSLESRSEPPESIDALQENMNFDRWQKNIQKY